MRFCPRCDNCRWVCEAHPDRPWDGPSRLFALHDSEMALVRFGVFPHPT
jgi:hypothetical protein